MNLCESARGTSYHAHCDRWCELQNNVLQGGNVVVSLKSNRCQEGSLCLLGVVEVTKHQPSKEVSISINKHHLTSEKQQLSGEAQMPSVCKICVLSIFLLLLTGAL